MVKKILKDILTQNFVEYFTKISAQDFHVLQIPKICNYLGTLNLKDIIKQTTKHIPNSKIFKRYSIVQVWCATRPPICWRNQQKVNKSGDTGLVRCSIGLRDVSCHIMQLLKYPVEQELAIESNGSGAHRTDLACRTLPLFKNKPLCTSGPMH